MSDKTHVLPEEQYIIYEGKKLFRKDHPLFYWEFGICAKCNNLNGAHSDKDCRNCGICPPNEEQEKVNKRNEMVLNEVIKDKRIEEVKKKIVWKL